jgi:hypothetical protein
MIGLIDFSNPAFNYRYKGYTAIINQAVDVSINHFSEHRNTNLIISDQQILDFFDPVFDGLNYDYNASNIFLENFFKNNTRHNQYNAHTIADMEDLTLRGEIFNKILVPTKEITDEVNQLLTDFNINSKTLGLHIRGTDKDSEIPKVPDDKIVDAINEILTEHKLDKIFLSTDDNYYLQLIKTNFKEKVLYNENNLISYDGNPLHFSNDRKKTNKDVLLDVYVLSNCEYFLYCYSNVSYLALTLGSKKQKHIKNINDEN